MPRRYIRVADRKPLDNRRPPPLAVQEDSNHNQCKRISRDPWGTVHTCEEKEESQ